MIPQRAHEPREGRVLSALGAQRAGTAWMACMIVALIVFAADPALDLATSRLFYSDGFALARLPVLELARQALLAVMALPALLAGLALGVRAFGHRLFGISLRIWLLILSLYALAPGLLANGLFKRSWGRARPVAVTDFGGSADFTPAFQISDQCASDCSFVSAETAAATAFLISVLVLAGLMPRGPAARLARIAATGGFLALASLRIMLGRHFLSDVVFSVLVTTGVSILLSRAVFGRRRTERRDERSLAR